ncbi:hypothetical protein Pst134EA_027690 [Puccinia striiformis f. sp. tritici]|uniref:hypothetical protein n=1 Tax=Puccinia striiformis f. sp. tritici TaxID=168172 RepID=UPI0020087727|nr:hypothetical protein Pst134EA_027690 [Puccinia striiformis f. sp. tritici]KAH9441985.1 hypothetical protein Pst134EB_028260 [Puccinia striiformis f. sp. tritici]KAH9448378.1 hypothetical protein Pst134EA_027690 [Puccinia striiformis f. sp. tritici]
MRQEVYERMDMRKMGWRYGIIQATKYAHTDYCIYVPSLALDCFGSQPNAKKEEKKQAPIQPPIFMKALTETVASDGSVTGTYPPAMPWSCATPCASGVPQEIFKPMTAAVLPESGG